MMFRVLISTVVVLLVFTSPVFAVEHLTAEDFKEPSPSVKINGKFSLDLYASIGSKISITYTIEPKNEMSTKKLDNRYYKFISDLKDVKIRVIVYYKNDGQIYHPLPDDEVGDNFLKIDTPETKYGIEKIDVNISGYIPNICERYKEVKALYIDVSDADENVLKPVIVKVYNTTAFNRDIKSYELKLSSLNSDISFLKARGYNVSNLLDSINSLKNDLEIAKDYLSSRDYKKSDQKLSGIESRIDDLIKTMAKMKANAYYVWISSELDNVSSILHEIDVQLAKITNKSEYNKLNSEYEYLKTIYNSVKHNVTIAKGYIELENYEKAISILKDQEKYLNDLKVKSNNLLNYLSTKNKSEFSISTDVFKIILPILIAIVVVILVLKRRRRGKWDELG